MSEPQTPYVSPRGYHCAIRGVRYTGDLKTLSETFCRLRDESTEGASTFPAVTVFEIGGGHQIGHISYNGRVWPGTCWSADAVPLYDNRLEPTYFAGAAAEQARASRKA